MMSNNFLQMSCMLDQFFGDICFVNVKYPVFYRLYISKNKPCAKDPAKSSHIKIVHVITSWRREQDFPFLFSITVLIHILMV